MEADGSPAAVWSRLAALPTGYFTALYHSRRYGVSLSVHAAGRSMKLFCRRTRRPRSHQPQHLSPR
jgi:hypothetical protein